MGPRVDPLERGMDRSRGCNWMLGAARRDRVHSNVEDIVRNELEMLEGYIEEESMGYPKEGAVYNSL